MEEIPLLQLCLHHLKQLHMKYHKTVSGFYYRHFNRSCMIKDLLLKANNNLTNHTGV